MTIAVRDPRQALLESDQRDRLAVEALDALSLGVVIVRGDGALIHCNRTAERIAAEGDGFELSAGRVSASSAGETRMLRAMVARAAGAEARKASLSLSRPSQARPYMLLISPLPRFGAQPVSTGIPVQGPVLILVSDPECAHALSTDDVRSTLGLTPAEARLFIAIAEGASLEEAAVALGVSLSTVRSHLQHIFARTGVSRQSELVLLASKLCSAYCAPVEAGESLF